MSNQKEFVRKQKEELPVVAVCYDFDKTLTKTDMQAQGFIQSLNWEVKDFWDKCNSLSFENGMDDNLAYMYRMVTEAEGKVLFTKKTLLDYGSRIELFPGVESWFDRINEYGREKGVIVEHYIISSGLKEMIEGTSIADKFERIYASSFLYNEKGVAVWPAQAINYTNKTQFLFRISKGMLDLNDQGVNDSIPPEQLRVPFRNMIYIGDSDTDVPCMKLVTSYGGSAIGVYDPGEQQKGKVYKMLSEHRIRFFAPADYSEDTRIDRLIKAMIDKTAAAERLEAMYFENKAETEALLHRQSERQKYRSGLCFLLENSTNYAATHTALHKLSKVEDWSEEDKRRLFEIAVRNSQVWLILTDVDVKAFYKSLLEGYDPSDDDNAAAVAEKLEGK